MKDCILLYTGPATPSDASMKAGPSGFRRSGIDSSAGDPRWPTASSCIAMDHTADAAKGLNGYSIVQAKELSILIDLVRDQPYLTQGSDAFTMEILELPG